MDFVATVLPQVLEPNTVHSLEITNDEAAVLDTFAEYLMAPDQMLCLVNSDLPSMKRALQHLVHRGWLTAQNFKGGYSLTVEGFHVMKRHRSERIAAKNGQRSK